MRNLVIVAAAIALAACSSSRGPGAADPVASGPAPIAAPAPSPVPYAVQGGATDAASLARETGLAFTDDGRTVLLSNADVRARMYPATGTLTIDGRGVNLSEPIRRDGGLVRVPGAAAEAVRRAVGDAAARRRSIPPPVALTPIPPLAEPPHATLKPVAVPPVAARDAGGDPSWTPPVSARGWRWIVVHHSDDHAGCFAKYDRVHRAKGWDGCGYDFVVGNGTESGDGEVEVTDRWLQQTTGAHTKTPDNRFNEYGVGICLVGDFERGGQPTERQYRSLVRLTRWLMARYGIPADRVVRHSDCKSTACPGRNFPWGRFQADVVDASSVASPP
jgi:N-acetylmuramoyl-L-alanine amidase